MKNKKPPLAVEQNERTSHGENIGDQIQEADAYGYFDTLTASDLWYILDNLQTHFTDSKNEPCEKLTTKWLREIEAKFPDMETS